MGMKWSKAASAEKAAQTATDKKQPEQMKSMQKAMLNMSMQVMSLQKAASASTTKEA